LKTRRPNTVGRENVVSNRSIKFHRVLWIILGQLRNFQVNMYLGLGLLHQMRDPSGLLLDCLSEVELGLPVSKNEGKWAEVPPLSIVFKLQFKSYISIFLQGSISLLRMRKSCNVLFFSLTCVLEVKCTHFASDMICIFMNPFCLVEEFSILKTTLCSSLSVNFVFKLKRTEKIKTSVLTPWEKYTLLSCLHEQNSVISFVAPENNKFTSVKQNKNSY